MSINAKITVAFDVNGTLIALNGQSRPEIIEIFHKFELLGCKMVIWSGGGEEYARRWAEKLNLKAEFRDKLQNTIKPDITFDDQVIKLGIINIQV